jgi:hypothetical protein
MPPRPIPSGKKKLAKTSKGTPPTKSKPNLTRIAQWRLIASYLSTQRLPPSQTQWDLHYLYNILRRDKAIEDRVRRKIEELVDNNRFQDAQWLMKRLDEWKLEKV